MTTAILIGITAWTFTMVLSDGDMIMGWWFRWIDKFPEWLQKPLGTCEYCLAGQLSMWYYLIYYFKCYDLPEHIMFVSLAIFTTEAINQIKHKLNN